MLKIQTHPFSPKTKSFVRHRVSSFPIPTIYNTTRSFVIIKDKTNECLEKNLNSVL